jgi:FkbM family methyltransferase
LGKPDLQQLLDRTEEALGPRRLGLLRGLRLRVYIAAVTVRRWLRIRRETVVTSHYEGFTVHYPALSIIGQAIASGTSWQSPLKDVVSTVLGEGPPPTIVDVGSNIGVSLIEIKRARADARVICFEPADRFAGLLERNVIENDIQGVTVERLLVGDEDAVRTLFVNTSTASVATDDYGGHDRIGDQRIRMVRLDSYLDASRSAEMLKIDTDGFDEAVVGGAQKTLRSWGPVIYCEFAPFLLEEVGGSGPEFLALLGSLGYGTIFPVLSSGQKLAAPLDHDGLLAAAAAERYIDIVAIHDLHPPQIAALMSLVDRQ